MLTRTRGNSNWLALGMGAVSGLRSMMAPALLSRALGSRGGRGGSWLVRLLANPVAGKLLPLMAVGELAADKHPDMPPRIQPLPLLGRASLGALVGAWAGSHRLRGALLGAAGAVGASYLGYWARRNVAGRPRAVQVMAGLAEDAVAFGAGRALLARA